ncbi:MAG: dephospho-CoA kinase [Flavobacteriaceae bacterium]|jgi:dephospho-CoA kinase
MILIGLTGGIGSGKSTVAALFEKNGYPVYNSDQRASFLMESNETIIQKLKFYFGDKVYREFEEKQELNRAYLSSIVFKDAFYLSLLNASVHPFVYADFRSWCQRQSSEILVKESALIFENEAFEEFDYTVLVRAEKQTRISRVQQRSGLEPQKIIDRMNAQIDPEVAKGLADYVLDNDGDLDELEAKFKLMLQRLKLLKS